MMRPAASARTRSLLAGAWLVVWIIGSTCTSEPLLEPRFIIQPSTSGNILSENRTKILQCQARGNPQPKYRWFKDWEPLSDMATTGSFRIQDLRRKDTGIYHCVATNDVGSIFSDRVGFSVAYMGKFDDLTDKVVAVEYGNVAILELPSIESNPSPAVTWFSSDGTELYGIKYAMTDHKLLILDATKSDEGSYRARAFNNQLGKEENSPFFKLQVTGDPNAEVAPSIVVKPENTLIIKGQSAAHIHCIANARSLHELRILWMKDDIPIENSLLTYSFNDSWNRTLMLISANMTYTGTYSCHVNLMSGGYPTSSASAKVVVYEKPKFNTELKKDTLSDYGSKVTLSCNVDGTPVPKITWFRNAEPIDHLLGSRYKIDEDGSLTIQKLTMDDSGMFQCLASNEAGEASSYTWLRAKKGLGSGLKDRVARRAVGYNVVRIRQSDRRFMFSQYPDSKNNAVRLAAKFLFTFSFYLLFGTCLKTAYIYIHPTSRFSLLLMTIFV